MSAPLVARRRARPIERRRRGAVTERAGRAALVLVLVTGLACGSVRQPVPLEPRGQEPEAIEPPTLDEPADAGVVSTIQEETLPDDTRPSAASATAVFDILPPPLLDTIDGATPPNVAAATRLVNTARQHIAEGDSGTALDQLEQAIALDPTNPYAYCYLAQLHFSHRDYDQAIAFADRAAALSGSQAPQWASRAYTLQGNAFEAIGRFPDARAAYGRAVAIVPDNLAAQVGLARVGGPSDAAR